MKKLVYTFVASLALVACTPNNGVSSKVRISVSFEDEQQSNKGQQRISAVDRVLDGKHVIDVNWQTKDMLYYQIGNGEINRTSPFVIVSGAGTKNAIFESDNLSLKNEKFNLYYGTEIPITQTIEIDNDNHTHIDPAVLLYKSSDCEIGKTTQFAPQFALLGVQLYGTEEKFDENVCMGNSSQMNNVNASDVYVIELKTSTSVNLTKNPIYYFVLPLNYDFTGKSIWLAEKKGHPSINVNTGFLTFNHQIELDSNVAQIIRISVNKTSDANYEITKYDQQ